MKAKLRQWIAMLMTLIMVFSSAPVGVLADEAAPAGTVVETRTEDGALNGEDATVVTGMKTETRGLSLRRVAAYKNTWHVVFTDGGATVAEQYLLPGETMIVPQVQETANHKFTGWVKQSGYGADAAPVGQAFTDALAQDETTVYAAAYQDVYYLFFHDVDEQDGRVLRTKEWVVGETTDALTTSDVRPSLSGNQEFEGWLEGGAPAQATYENLTGDVHLYPDVATGHWITFDVDGGAAIEPEFVVGNTVRPADPVRPGYRFDGWFDASGAAFTFGGTLTENITLTARWTAQSVNYTVVFLYENANDKNYSYVGSYTGTATTGSTVSINKTTADGYAYSGKDLTNFHFDHVEPATATIAGDGSTVINVYYAREVYEVRFYNNRGNSEDTSKRITAKYGAFIGGKWPGGGWYVNRNSTNTAQSYLEIMPSGGKNFYGQQTGYSTSTATYYVEVLAGETGTVVSGKTYKVHHTDTAKSNGGLSVSDEERYDITGFTCNTAISTKNGSTYNGSKFYYTRNTYTLTFNNSDNTLIRSATHQFEADLSGYAGYEPAASDAPAGKEGYKFAGWYDNNKGSGSPYTFGTMPASDVVLYAHWVKPEVSAEYFTVMVGGSAEQIDVEYGKTIDQTKLPTPTASEGYEFVYWAREVDGQLHPFNFATVIKENIVLRPYFIPKGSVQVTYDKNGGKGNPPEDSQHYVVKESYADVRAGANLTKNGKAFSHWTLNADGTGDKYYPGDKLLVTGAVTLYAQYITESDRFTLSFELAGGNVDGAATLPSETLYKNQKHQLPTPTRAGYTFGGWKDLAGNMWNGGSDISLTSDDTVTAQWTARTDMPYTVEFYYQNDNQQGYAKDDSLTAIRNNGATDQTVSVTDTDKGQTRNGQYKLNEGASTLTATVAADGSTVLKLYFDLNQFTVTIHYVYADGQAPADNPLGGNKAADDFSDVLTVGVWYRVDSPDINGYTASEEAVSGTMGAGNVEHTVVYTKRADLSYTINYYWVGTKDKVAESTTVTGCTFNDVKSLAPLAVTNYTPVSNETVHLTIGTGENVVNFYYYKNIALQGNSDTVTYDGKEHSVSGFTGQILPDGTAAPADLLAATGFTVGAKGTDAGTYDAEFPANAVGTVVNGQYYVSEAVKGQLIIDPVTDKVTVTIKGHTDTRTYNGTKHTVTGYDWSADNTLYTSDCFRFNGKAVAEGVDADTYPMGIQKSDFENISNNFEKVEFVLEKDGQLVVNPLEVELTANSATKAYDGTPLTNSGYTITKNRFVEGNENALLSVTVTGSQTVPGSSPNVITAYQLNTNVVKEKNYRIILKDGTLTVTNAAQRQITLEAKSDEVTYDGATHTVSGFKDTEIVRELADGTVEVTLTLNGQQVKYIVSGLTATVSGKDANHYDNVVTGTAKVTDAQGNDVTDQFTVTANPGKLTINPREVTLVSAGGEKVYDGTPLTSKWLLDHGKITQEITQTGTFVEGEVTNIRATGSVTNVSEGAKYNTIEYDVGEGFKAGNYIINKVQNELRITPVTDEVRVLVRGVTDNKVYNGQVQTASGYTVTIEDATGLYTGNDFTYKGKPGDSDAAKALATASRKDVGLTIMGLAVGVENNFKNVNSNFANVEFDVDGGGINITPLHVHAVVPSNGKTHGQKDPAFADAQLTYGQHDAAAVTPTSEVLTEIGAIDWSVHRTDAGDDHVGNHDSVLTVRHTVASLEKTYTNYTFHIENGNFVIHAEDDSLILNLEDYVGIYDGQYHGVKSVAVYQKDLTAENPAFAPVTGATVYFFNEETQAYDLTECPTIKNVADGPITVKAMVTVDGITAYDEATVTITPRAVSYRSTDAEKTYDGAPLTNSSVARTSTLDFVPGEVTRVYTEGTVTNAFDGPNGNGVVDNVIRLETTDSYIESNYTLDLAHSKLTIQPRHVQLVSESATKPYDGTPLTRPNATVKGDGFVPAELESVRAIGTITDVLYDAAGNVIGEENTVVYRTKGAYDERNYVFDTPDIGTLTVTPVEDEVVVTVTGHTLEKTYDGKEHVVSGFDMSCDNELYHVNTDVGYDADLMENDRAARATDVNTVGDGKYMMGLTASDFTNLNRNFKNVTFRVTDGWLKINPVVITIKAADDQKPYDGTPLTNSNWSITGGAFVGSDEGFASVTVEGTQTLVGSADNLITDYVLNDATNRGNYTVTTEKGTLTVMALGEKLQLTVEALGGEFTYDGSEHTVSGFKTLTFTLNGATFTVEGLTSGAARTNSGTTETQVQGVSKVLDAEGNDVSNQFTVHYQPANLVVKPRAVTLTSASGEKVYDGTALTSKWLLAQGRITEEVTVSGDGFAAGEGATFGVIGSRVNVGKSDNEFAYRLNRNTDANNYTIKVVKGKLEVTPVTDQVTVTITGHTDSKVYNGQTQQVEGYDVAISNPLYTENDFTYEGSQTASGVNADTYPMGMDKNGFANINQNFTNVIFDVTDGGLTITKRPVTITVANDEKEYGNPDPTFANAVMTGQVLGELGGIDHTVTRTNTAEQVGKYPGVLRISATKEDLEKEYTNYTFTVGSGDFTIKARTEKYVITVVANSGSFTYDGSEHTVSGFETLTFVVDGHTYKVSGLVANVTAQDADRYTVQVLGTAKVTDEQENDVTGQFTVKTENGEMVISPRHVILTSASGKKVYDGTALTSKWLLDNGKIEEEVTVSGNGFAAGEGATYTVSGSRVNVGTADNTFTYRLNAGVKASNYTIETFLGELEVTPVTDQVTVTITEHSATVEYDGAAHTVTGYDVTSISNGLYKHGDFSFSGNDSVTGTDVGRYEMKVKPSDFTNNNQNFTNVVFVIVDGALVITPRGADPRNPVTIKANDLVVGYNGLEHGENGYTATRLAEGHSVRSVIIDGKQKLVGIYPEEFKPHDAIIVDKEGKDVTANYKVTYKDGDLTITGDEVKPEKTTPQQVSRKYALGYPIPFTITVQSVAKDAVKNVIVRDGNAVLAEGDGYRLQDAHTAIIDVLEPGATVIVKAYHKVTSDDILAGTVGNTATVSWENTTRTVNAGTSQLEGVDVTLDVVKTSDLKTPDGAKKAALGTSIRYTITVTNNGNVPYYNVRVDDDMTGLHEVIGTLPVGETRTFYTAYTVTEQDLLNGQVENLVTAEGRKVEDPKDGTLKTPKGEDTEIDQTESVQTTLSIAKTSNKKAGETAALNERITYTLTVKNTGNVTLYNVHVDDDLTGLHETVSTLKKGDEKTFTTFYTVTEQDILNGRVFNVATAKADPVIDPADPEHPVVPSDRAEKEDETDDVCTDLSVRKLSDRKPEDKAKLGEVINYTITVKNTGNVTYYNVHVDDDLTGMHETIAVLGVGEEKTFTTSYTVTEQDILNGRVLNVATAKGNPIVDPKDPEDPKIPEDEDKKEDDTEDVRVTMTLEKTVVNLPARGYFVAGEEAQFHLTVKNTGNQTLRNVRVTEMLTGASVKNGTGYTVVNGAAVADEMKPGDTVTVNAVYTVRAEDIGETVENVAVARGEGPVDPKDETRRIDPEEQWARAQVPVDEAFRARGHVIWQDKSNAFDTRPGSVQVTLLADGVPVDEQTVIGEGDSWLFIFDKQPAHHKDGTPIVYTVKQDDHTGYTVTYPADTLDIVNDLEKYTLTIRYWMFKVGGEAAFHPVVRDYYYGESYSVVSPKKEGFWPSISRVEGVMREDVEYDVVYDWVNYNLTIHYVYLDGAQAAPAYTATLHMGDEYQVLSPYIEGYTPTIREPKGVMPARDVTYTVIYLADEEPIVVPDAPSGMGPAFNAGECFE